MGGITKGCLKLFLLCVGIIAGVGIIIYILWGRPDPVVEYRFYGSASHAYIAYMDPDGDPAGGNRLLAS